MPGNFAPFEAKMRADGLSDAAVAAFKNAYDALTSGTRQRCSHSEGAFLLDEIRAADITGRKSLARRCRRDAPSTATAARHTTAPQAPRA